MADLSSQVQDTTKDTASSKEQESPGAFNSPSPSLALIVPIAVNLESVPRSGAGVVNDAGEVLDDAGKTVGKIADTDNLQNLVGNTVNQAGDVVSSSGDVLGKTLPIGQGKPEEEEDSHDEEKSEYTTQSKEKKSGGLGSALGSVTGTVGKAVGGATGAVGDTAKGATDTVGDTAKGATDTVGLGDTVKGATDTVGDTAKGATDTVGDTAEGATDTVGGATEGIANKSEATSQATDTKTPAETPGAPEVKDETPDAKSEDQDQKDISLEDRDAPEAGDKLKEIPPESEEAKEATDKAEETAEGVPDQAKDIPEEAKEDVASKVDEQDVPKPEDVEEKLQEKTEGAEDEVPKSEVADEVPSGEAPGDDGDKSKAGDDLKSVAPGEEAAGVTDEVQDKTAEGEEAAKDLPEDAQSKAAEGQEAAEGKVAEGDEAAADLPEDAKSKAAEGEETAEGKLAEGEDAAKDLPEDAQSKAAEGEETAEGKVAEGEIKQLIGLTADEQGTIWDKTGKKVGKAEPLPEWERGEQKDYSILKGTTVDKNGNLVNEKGHLFGKVVEGEIKQLIGLASDDQGTIWDKTGKAVGKAEPLPEWERGEQKDFSILKGAVVDKEGGLTNDKGDTIGKVTEGEVRQLVGLKSDENGKIWRDGKVVGQAEPLAEWDRVQKKDRSILKGAKVNKVGKLVDANGTVVGKVVEGELKELIGKRADENGDIWNDSGEVIGKGEPVSISEREDKASAPFEHFPGATVESDGRVMYQGEQVGEVVEGDPKQLKGSEVDEDGDILDRRGNTIGKAKRWEAPEAEEEKPVDNSALAGKRVNKAGNLVSESGEIYGRVIEGDVQKLVGRMSDKDGNIRSESGDIIGKAELVSEGERGGKKEGPFAQLKNCTVGKDGKVVNGAGEVVGKLVIGDAKALAGRAVDDDGEITDSNGNVIGKAERWEEPEKEQKHNPLAGRKVNREGNVVDADGNIIGKLTSGELLDCAGKEIDEDGDVFNQKGSVIGHVSLLEDIHKEEEPEPEGETEEERLKREQAEADEAKQTEEAEKNKKLAQQLAYQIEQTLERLRPICKSINDKISAAEAQKPEDRDEEELVRQVKPLIEDGGKILTETNGIIRGLDPDGRIARNAKQKTAGGEATPEEAHLANLLKELSTEIQTTIEEGKRKLEGMPHAKKEINPLWGLLAEPLFQIVAAVGLLLSGVLGLVGKLLGPILGPLLNGLGLGGLLDGLLGGLGLKKILGSLGLGDVVGTVTAFSTINNHHAQLASGVAFLNDATMRLFLIRHGETVDNVANLYAGSRDSALTVHGVMQAQRLASHFSEHVAIDRIFSSNLSRAVHTAQAILNAQKRAEDLKLIQVPELREKDFGTGEGTKFGAATKHEGSETPLAMRKRVDVFLDEHLPRLDEDSTVCIVAHGIILGTFYKALRDRTSSSAGPDAEPEGQASTFVRPSWSNTGYIEALVTRDSSDKHLHMRVVKINSVDHLKGLRKTRGGIGSAKFDVKQKTMDSFFKPTSRKRKLEDEDIVSR
ncbi:hypothetical protein FGLOB1_13520 [Fusarium globosum]|uniref:DUF6987 domain-containing protein n=1 Tax=Fusarium globosum TaxID=78864 RepID=A0A8H6CY07_9HYPO|nr:hypothetical protein FGLOB1_13520 [Fusarium globosum]